MTAVLFIAILLAVPLVCYLTLRWCWWMESRELNWRYDDTMRRARATLDREIV